MKLQTKQLKQFKAVTSGIKNNGIIPILSYLKFDKGTITKSNLESFVIMDADVSDTMLIDEKLLMNFVDFTDAEIINVTVKGKSVLITDGKAKVTSPTDDVINFPAIAESNGDPIELNARVINALRVASNFTIENTSMPFVEAIFIGRGRCSASTGFIAYTEAIEDTPDIIIHKDVAPSLVKFESLMFSENDTYQFYENGSFKFGFVKNDTKFLDLTKLAVLPEDMGVIVSKTEIIKFCDICVSNTPGRKVVAGVDKGVLSMKDDAYGINIEIPLSVELEAFNFNPILMSKMLKSIPGEDLTFIKSTNKYFITNNDGFVSLIMEIKP